MSSLAIPLWATNRRPATLPSVPTNELSFAVDQFTGSGTFRTRAADRTHVAYMPDTT